MPLLLIKGDHRCNPLIAEIIDKGIAVVFRK
jgi:hypothetical protein